MTLRPRGAGSDNVFLDGACNRAPSMLEQGHWELLSKCVIVTVFEKTPPWPWLGLVTMAEIHGHG